MTMASSSSLRQDTTPTTPTAAESATAEANVHPNRVLQALRSRPQAAVTPSSTTPGRHSSKFGTVNYSVDEMRRLNEKVRAVMPLVGEDWLHVAYQFNYMRPESIPYREVESLKRKFKKMYCARASGSGKLPDYVEEAKELRRLINQRSEKVMSTASSEHPANKLIKTPEAVSTDADGPTATDETTDVVAMSAEAAAAASSAETTVETEAVSVQERLQQMEEEYHRSMEAKGHGRKLVTTSLVDPLLLGASSSPLGLSGTPSSTQAIISMLKHSVERKKRTVEEQMLSESERVRKERKKRKMEQVLLSIHQEQCEKETTSTPTAQTTSATRSSVASALENSTASSSTMELMLQLMVTQQQEMARWMEMEERRRRMDQLREEQRRKEDEERRKQDKRELMLLMSALLVDQFPASLRHYLDDESAYNDEQATATDDDVSVQDALI